MDSSDHGSSVLSAVSEEQGGDTSSSKVSSETGSNLKSSSESQSEVEIAKAETKMVTWSKLLVYVVLMLTAVGSGIATYEFVKKGELNDFHKTVSITLEVKGQEAFCLKMRLTLNDSISG